MAKLVTWDTFQAKNVSCCLTFLYLFVIVFKSKIWYLFFSGNSFNTLNTADKT